MSQTAVNPAGQPAAVAGQITDNQEGMDIVSRFNAETALNIDFGLGVAPGTERNAVKVMANGECEGISVQDFRHSPGVSGDVDQTSALPGLKPKAGMQILRRGRIWLRLDKSVTSVTPYVSRGYCRYTADGTTNPLVGAWAIADDTGKTKDCTKQVQFVSGIFTAADGTSHIAEADVDFTNKQ